MLNTYEYKINFCEVEYFAQIHEVLKRDLGLPDYYGGTTDALWDCLTDMLGGVNYVEIYGFDNVKAHYPEEAQDIYDVFYKAKHAYDGKYVNRFFVTLIHEDGTRESVT